jgi:hypothetical protein
MKTLRPSAGSLKVVAGVFLISTALGLFFNRANLLFRAALGPQCKLGAGSLLGIRGLVRMGAVVAFALMAVATFSIQQQSWLKSAFVHMVAGASISVLHAALCAVAAISPGLGNWPACGIPGRRAQSRNRPIFILTLLRTV